MSNKVISGIEMKIIYLMCYTKKRKIKDDFNVDYLPYTAVSLLRFE